MDQKRAAIILAAGKSSRMNSSKSKVLHCVGGQSMLAWSASLARAANVYFSEIISSVAWLGLCGASMDYLAVLHAQSAMGHYCVRLVHILHRL